MSTIHHLPDANEAERQAALWIARLHADDVTPEDLAQFEEWHATHPRHGRAYEEISATIDQVKHAGRLVRAVSFGSAMNAASAVQPADGHRPMWHHSRLGWAAAAAIAMLVVAAAWWLQRSDSETVFQTALGEHASIELPDGSRLDLNSNSLASVAYTAQARTIHLERGEAFFKVAHELQRPFWVVARNSWIRAVGTAFNVDLRPNSVRVIVSDGIVKVATSNTADAQPSDTSLLRRPVSVLKAGQQAEMKSGTAQIRSAKPIELIRVSAWRKGKLYFENQHLEAVIEDVGRYTKKQIIIEDEALRQLPIGGTFQANAQGVDALLDMLEQGFGLNVRRESDARIYIEAAR